MKLESTTNADDIKKKYPYFAMLKHICNPAELVLVGATYTIRIKDGHSYTTYAIKENLVPYSIGAKVTLIQE